MYWNHPALTLLEDVTPSTSNWRVDNFLLLHFTRANNWRRSNSLGWVVGLPMS